MRKVRAEELKKRYKFDELLLDAYGVAKVSIRRVHKKITPEDEERRRTEYLEKLCQGF